MQSLQVRLIDFGLRKYEGAQDVEWPEGVYAPMTGCPPCVEVPAMRCPLGNESTIEAFIWHLLLVMRELGRVLRDDGTCWVNLGDSYAADRGGTAMPAQTVSGGISGKGDEDAFRGMPEQGSAHRNAKRIGVKHGDLMAIPHRFALAAQADGWVLRNDCVWHKKSCMPESVSGWKWIRHQAKAGTLRGAGKQATNEGSLTAQTGGVDKAIWTDCPGCDDCDANNGYVLRKGSLRHTRAHEYVFQFVKQMGYYMDDANFKEMSQMPSDFADEQVLLSQENWPSDFQMQDVLKRSPQGVFPKREGQGSLSEMVFDGGQSRANEKAAGVQENGSGQGCELEVREIGKRQNKNKALQPERSSQDQETSSPSAQNGKPRIQGKDSILLAKEEQRSSGQKTVQEIHHIPEGQASEIIEGSKVQEISAWPGISQAEQRETQAAASKRGMHADVSGMGRDSGSAESSLLLLQEADGKANSGSCNSSQQRRKSHERERSGGMPAMQSKEGQSSNQRNPRSVLTPKPSSYKGAHFAVFPPELIRPLILSSVPRRCCPECGQGWAAVVDGVRLQPAAPSGMREMGRWAEAQESSLGGRVMTSVSGYRPTCQCGREDYKPGIVLDPFVGSGTTLEVARECSVRAIGLDRSHEYLSEQASWRGLQIAKPDFSAMPLFAEMEAAA